MPRYIMGPRLDAVVDRGQSLIREVFCLQLDVAKMLDSESARSPRSGSPTSSSSTSSVSSSSSSSSDEEGVVEMGNDGSRKSLLGGSNDGDKNGPSCLTISVYTAVVVACVCLFLVLGRDYIKYVLISLEDSSLWISFSVFAILFTVVSFPMTWGYILLNIAAGYLYGLYLGVCIILICALFGLFTAHTVMRGCLRNFVSRRLANDSIRALMKVVDSDQGFKIVFLARLTPIPFGLQNGLFAVSNISTTRFLAASLIGMFPTQGMHAYIGSTLRSMEEVISSGSSSFTAQMVFIAQILMAIVLLLYVIRRAKQELNKAVASKEAASSGDISIPSSPNGKIPLALSLAEEGEGFGGKNGVITMPPIPSHKRNNSLAVVHVNEKHC